MSKNGNNTETISVSLPSDLIDSLNYFSSQRDINKSAAIKEALKDWVAKELSKKPEFWDRVYYGIHNRSKQKLIF